MRCPLSQTFGLAATDMQSASSQRRSKVWHSAQRSGGGKGGGVGCEVSLVVEVVKEAFRVELGSNYRSGAMQRRLSFVLAHISVDQDIQWQETCARRKRARRFASAQALARNHPQSVHTGKVHGRHLPLAAAVCQPRVWGCLRWPNKSLQSRAQSLHSLSDNLMPANPCCPS